MLEMDVRLQALNIKERRIAVEPTEDLEEISLDDNIPGRVTCISMQVDLSVHKDLALFLKNNRDVFSWSHEDMLGINSNIMVHKLNVCSSFPPSSTKKRVFAQERDKVIAKEVHMLLVVDFIREVPRMFGQRSDGQKSERQVENVCRFHRPKQSMP